MRTQDLRAELDSVGYLIVDDVIPERLIDDLVSAMARLVAAARGSDLQDDASPADAVLRLAADLIELSGRGETWVSQALDISLPQKDIQATTPMFLTPEAFALLAAEPLLDVVSRLIGPEIWLSPVGHTRLKVPQSIAPAHDARLGATAWHQDNGVYVPQADDTDILTVWIPLGESTVENGCLRVLPGPPTTELIEHCAATGFGIPKALLPPDQPRELPMRKGSVLFLHKRIVHASVPNTTTNKVRISMDLRYQAGPTPSPRPQFPSFQVRSADAEQRTASWSEWRDGWLSAREHLAAAADPGSFNRWTRSEGCA